MAYERTASGGKREKIPKYGTDKYRSSEHITPLHSDLSGGDYTYKNKKGFATAQTHKIKLSPKWV